MSTSEVQRAYLEDPPVYMLGNLAAPTAEETANAEWVFRLYPIREAIAKGLDPMAARCWVYVPKKGRA